MIHARPRPLVPNTLLLALLVAVLAFVALAALASAEKVGPYPSGSLTPAAFKKACLDTGGGFSEQQGADGVPMESKCYHFGKKSSECNWIKKTCTDYPLYPVEPTSGGVGGPVDDGVLDGGPRRTEPVLDDGR